MKPSNKIVDFIKKQEGFSPKAYKPLPTDRWTVGYGFTYLNGQPVTSTDTINQSEADKIITDQVDKIGLLLEGSLEPLGKLKLKQNQLDAVTSLTYNLGMHQFLNSETGHLFLKGQNISDKFLLWDRSGGRVVEGLLNRRTKEKEIYDSATYPVD